MQNPICIRALYKHTLANGKHIYYKYTYKYTILRLQNTTLFVFVRWIACVAIHLVQ
jgi:hypothetical protein